MAIKVICNTSVIHNYGLRKLASQQTWLVHHNACYNALHILINFFMAEIEEADWTHPEEQRLKGALAVIDGIGGLEKEIPYLIGVWIDKIRYRLRTHFATRTYRRTPDADQK